MASSTSLRVFLAHSKEDKLLVLEIYYLLQLDGFIPWVDKENLVPGQNWELEIEKAVRASHAVIAFISSFGIDRAGYLNKEIALAIDVAERQPEGAIYIIPLCLDNCEPPRRLSHLQHSMLPRDMVADIYVTLRSSLLARATDLGFITTEQLQEMPTAPVMVKAGTPSQLRPGRYLVRGQNPDDGKYYGIAEVKKSNDEYLITWYIGGHEIKGHGQVPHGDLNELVRISVQGKYEVLFARESWSGIYKGTWGSGEGSSRCPRLTSSGGIEELIPASPMVHSRTRVG